MFDLEELAILIPNTEAIRELVASLNYKITPIYTKDHKELTKYRSICFVEWLEQFERVKQSTKLYYCIENPTLTEDQATFLFTILHICPDAQTFKEALKQYIDDNP